MAKKCSTLILNQAASFIMQNSAKMCILSTVPANLAACTASTVLVTRSLTTAMFTIADGDVSGKKVTLQAFNTSTITSTGVPKYVVLFSTVGTTGIHYYTTCSSAQALLSTNNSVNIPSWKIEFRDAT